MFALALLLPLDTSLWQAESFLALSIQNLQPENEFHYRLTIVYEDNLITDFICPTLV